MAKYRALLNAGNLLAIMFPVKSPLNRENAKGDFYRRCISAVAWVNRRGGLPLRVYWGVCRGCGKSALLSFAFSTEKLPPSQQATKFSVTHFNSSQRSRIADASLSVI